MTALEASGEILHQGAVSNRPEALVAYFQRWKSEEACRKRGGRVEVAVETCGFWRGFRRTVEPLVDRLVLVHAAKVKAIAAAALKNDKVDSAMLAHLLRTNLLPEAWISDAATTALRDQMRLRVALSRQRAQWKNQIHGALHQQGVRAPRSDLFGKQGREWLAQVELGVATRLVVNTCLELIDQLSRQITALDRQVAAQAEADADVRCLMSIPGIGPCRGLLIKAEIGDIHRFPSKRQLFSYAGLVPVVRESAGKSRRGPITRAGSPLLRWAMVQAAHSATRCSPGARAYFERLAQRKPRHKARVALARKLLAAVHALWRHGVCFEEEVFAAM
jgi:transposase